MCYVNIVIKTFMNWNYIEIMLIIARVSCTLATVAKICASIIR